MSWPAAWLSVLVLSGPPALVAQIDPGLQPMLDRTYDLNITQERIDRGPYDVSAEVGIQKPVAVQVGVSVHAGRISLVLTGVRGTARFHGDLSRITRILSAHVRATSAL